MKAYQDLLKNIMENGVEKESGRANMPNTIGISNAIIKCDLEEGECNLMCDDGYYLKQRVVIK